MFDALVLGLTVDEILVLWPMLNESTVSRVKPRAIVEQKRRLLACQWRVGDASMLKHLGKLYLGQDDSQTINSQHLVIPYENLAREVLLNRMSTLITDMKDDNDAK